MLLSDIMRVVVNFLLLQLLYTNFSETQIALEVIFVKPEVKFLSPEMALVGF